MMESNLILFTQLNDFMFCPASIYYHNLYGEADKTAFQSETQINGTYAHKSIDEHTYSSKTSILQGIMVFSEKYGLVGKIDVFDVSTGVLTERKRLIKNVYEGFVFQTYAECLSLREAGYTVNEIRLHSLSDNKSYKVDLPEKNEDMFSRFVKLIDDMRDFCIDDFKQDNVEKCRNCIYEPACDSSLL